MIIVSALRGASWRRGRISPRALMVAGLGLAALAYSARRAGAQSIDFFSTPDGYTSGSITLPEPFGGALAVDVKDARLVYAALGSFGAMKLAQINLVDGSTKIVADGPFGAISGIAAFSSRRIAIIDSSDASGGPKGETILLAEDADNNGDFNGPHEIREVLHAKPNSQGDFTGAQARVVPENSPEGIKPGSLMFQTANGDGNAGLYAIKSPTSRSKARYYLNGHPLITGFDYNGGFDFDSQGRIIMGAVAGDTLEGSIWVIDRRNLSHGHGGHEGSHGAANQIVTGEPGCADLVVSHGDRVFFAGMDEDYYPAVRSFDLPAQPLAETVVPDTFAEIDGGFVSAILLTTQEHSFAPASGSLGATMLIGGFDSFFDAATNLLTLKPSDPPGHTSTTPTPTPTPTSASALLHH